MAQLRKLEPPAEYVQVVDVRFVPAGEGGGTGRLTVTLRASAPLSGPPCPVELVLPQDGLWVAARYAERVDVLAQDEESVKVRAWLLPPVPHRVGLITLIAGEGAFVVAPPELRDADRDVARELLAHHETPVHEAPVRDRVS